VDLYHHSSPPFTNWIIGNGLLREDFVVLDIGCQGGEHPRWGLLGDRLAFYGFDPIREVIEKMRAERRPRRTYFDFALGDEDGERKFLVGNNLFGSSFLSADTEEHSGDPAVERGRRMVQVRRLDSLFADGVLPRADYIKLDCESFEPYVLRGAREYLAASGPICVTSESAFGPSPHFPHSHFQAVNEILIEHRLFVFDVNMVRAPRAAYAAARRRQPWPEPDPVGDVPRLDVGAPGTLDIVFCRDFVAEELHPAQYCFDPVVAGTPHVDRLIKAMINFELHGLMDCAFDLGVRFRDRLGERFDVHEALNLLLLPPPHARNTTDVTNCLAMVAALRSSLLAANERALSDASRIAELARLLDDRDLLLAQRDAELDAARTTLDAVYNSGSWRVTAPIRQVMTWLRH
jgi:FkbM family methyltransferase